MLFVFIIIDASSAIIILAPSLPNISKTVVVSLNCGMFLRITSPEERMLAKIIGSAAFLAPATLIVPSILQGPFTNNFSTLPHDALTKGNKLPYTEAQFNLNM